MLAEIKTETEIELDDRKRVTDGQTKHQTLQTLKNRMLLENRI